jgi:hypothetical protein
VGGTHHGASRRQTQQRRRVKSLSAMTPRRFRLTPERAAQFKDILRDPMGQRKVLDTPIRINKVARTKQQREKQQSYIAEEIAKKRRALLIHYHIPEEWDELTQLRWLVDHLAAKVHRGFRVITKQTPAFRRGGPSPQRQRKMAERKYRLLKRYEAYKQKNSHINSSNNDLDLIKLFLQDEKNRRDCIAAGFVKLSPKSISQALKKLGSETPP